jgi:shikimate kinase
MKTIYLLIGQKGSGKSHIGTLLDHNFNIRFLRVENWVKAIKQERKINDESYLKEVFQTIEKGVRNELRIQNSITFESTGLTKYFDQMLESLNNDFNVITVKIKAAPELCLQRVKSRNQSIHINISDKEVKSINEAVFKKRLIADFNIDNNNKSDVELIIELKKITTPQHLI